MSIKETVMVTIAATVFLLATGVAKAEPAKTNLGENIESISFSISAWLSNEIDKTKQYQKKQWSESRNKFTKFFSGNTK